LKSVGDFWRIAGERMITSNRIALRARSFFKFGESAGLLM